MYNKFLTHLIDAKREITLAMPIRTRAHFNAIIVFYLSVHLRNEQTCLIL